MLMDPSYVCLHMHQPNQKFQLVIFCVFNHVLTAHVLVDVRGSEDGIHSNGYERCGLTWIRTHERPQYMMWIANHRIGNRYRAHRVEGHNTIGFYLHMEKKLRLGKVALRLTPLSGVGIEAGKNNELQGAGEESPAVTILDQNWRQDGGDTRGKRRKAAAARIGRRYAQVRFCLFLSESGRRKEIGTVIF